MAVAFLAAFIDQFKPLMWTDHNDMSPVVWGTWGYPTWWRSVKWLSFINFLLWALSLAMSSATFSKRHRDAEVVTSNVSQVEHV